MAKIFVKKDDKPIEPENLPKGNNPKVSKFLDRVTNIVFSLGLVLAIVFIVIRLEEKKGMNKDKVNMGLEKQVEMKNGKILTLQVRYETSKKIDPDDTSGIFFEVVNGNDDYKEGDLVKFNHRFIELQQLDSVEYAIIDPLQIHFKINKKDVKESILKR